MCQILAHQIATPNHPPNSHPRSAEHMSWDKMEFAAASIRHKLTKEPQVGLVLGSGLGGFAETLEDPVFVDYKSMRDFPVSTVEGHKGRFVIGHKHGLQIIAMQGRVHRYEGFSAHDVVF